jgi:Domain of unknown function (DUF4124)
MSNTKAQKNAPLKRYGQHKRVGDLKMKFLLLIALLILPILASAQIYKCIQADGKVGFSDKPCSKNVIQERVEEKPKKTDWVSRLQEEKPASIIIIDVLRQDDDVIIKYEFKTKSESNEFLKLANKVSNMPIVLMKYIAPESGSLGRAEIKASNKPNPLFEELGKSKGKSKS